VVRLGAVGRGARRRTGRAGKRALTPALDKLLRQALEAAVAVAREGEDDTPVVPAPPGLRPFVRFSKLPTPAVVAARRAVDGDEEFRERVAAAVTEAEVGRAGWLWLTRPEGWESELDAMAQDVAEAGEVAADRRAENEARRRLAGAEAATQRAEALAATAQAESARAAAALAEERRARRAAADRAEELAALLEAVTAERDKARVERDRAREEGSRGRRRLAKLKEGLEELRVARPTPAEAEATPAEEEPAEAPGPGVEEVRQAATALFEAAGAAAGMAESLRLAALALGAEPPSPLPAAAPPASRAEPASRVRRLRPPRRVPVALPPGVVDDSTEAAEHLCRVPGMTILVDGYNVSQLGWPELTIAEQRRRLVDALTELAARTGADVSVVFDGAEAAWPASVPTTSRLVKVSFSPGDVEADDVVLGRVAELDVARPVLVASTDRRVRDGASGLGANVISSAQLLAVLRR
jgi:predicted RNA-binding protein with PIN domain